MIALVVTEGVVRVLEVVGVHERDGEGGLRVP